MLTVKLDSNWSAIDASRWLDEAFELIYPIRVVYSTVLPDVFLDGDAGCIFIYLKQGGEVTKVTPDVLIVCGMWFSVKMSRRMSEAEISAILLQQASEER